MSTKNTHAIATGIFRYRKNNLDYNYFGAMSVTYNKPTITAIGGFDFTSLTSYSLGDTFYHTINAITYVYFTVFSG